MSTRGFGLAGEYSLETITAAGLAAEQAGYGSFWLSQPREGSSLAKLDEVSRITNDIRLGVGAIPLTLHSPGEIEALTRNLSMAPARLRLGLGSGTGPGSMDRLRRGVAEIRSRLDVEIIVAPLGPKMCRLAGELADAVLLNWLTPAHASTSRSWIEDGARDGNRPVPIVGAYVRCALGPESISRLDMECARYSSFPHYAAHFQRQGVEPIDTTIRADNADELQERLVAYEAVLDEVVVRAITPGDEADQVLELIESARPAGR